MLFRSPAAGSKGAPKNPGELKDDTSSSREEKQVKLFQITMISLMFNHFCIFIKTMQILMRALSSPPFANYRVWWSLADSKYAGTALFVKKCFQPKNVFFNLDRIGNSFCNDLYFLGMNLIKKNHFML